MNRTGIKDRVVWNVASQTLTFESPHGRPSSDGTVTLYDPRYDPDDTTHNPIVTGTATRTAVATVMSGAAGPGESDPRSVPITSGNMTAIASAVKVGDPLWLYDASSQPEHVEVVKLGATSLGVRDKLWNTYAAQASVFSAVMTSPAIPTAWIQSADNADVPDCYALWTYTVNGITYRDRTYFDVTRFAGQEVGPDRGEVLDEYPSMEKLLSDKRFVGYRRSALKDVDQLMRLRGIRSPQKLHGTESIQWLVGKCLAFKLACDGLHPQGVTVVEHKQTTEKEWESAQAQWLEGPLPVPLDEDDDGAYSSDDRAEIVGLLR